ncbi:MAG: hypothetical protein K6G61_03580 [Solobacterium sp.]|nr:hypothetical protein [Solobacterium sp.]
MKCTICGSKRTAPISYGLPDYTEEVVQRVRNEEVYFAGCLIIDGYPHYHCFACGRNVATIPVRRMNGKLADYRLIVSDIRFSYGNDPVQLHIEKKDGTILLEVLPAPGSAQPPFQRDMTETEWDGLLEKLYGQLYIHEWDRVFIRSSVPDGENWKLAIQVRDGKPDIYIGKGVYPPYWEELQVLLRPYFAEAGILNTFWPERNQ